MEKQSGGLQFSDIIYMCVTYYLNLSISLIIILGLIFQRGAKDQNIFLGLSTIC